MAGAGGAADRCRTVARRLALRAAPTERCLFIGDEVSAKAIRGKFGGHGG